MGWRRHQRAIEEILESREVAEDVSYEYEEPERGQFDYPHRIRSVQQMLDDDKNQPITGNGFLAYSEKAISPLRARAEYDLSLFEFVPDVEGVEPEAVPEPEVEPVEFTLTKRPGAALIERLLDRLGR